MSYSIEYEPEAIASLKKVSATHRKRIIAKINWLAENFEQITPQPLTADFSGFYKLRIGDYRVIYEFNPRHFAILEQLRPKKRRRTE
ncbi:MAG: type II toxin-antitoxin system RelE/ParE family toxin [Leptolyngbyaceae cyanobacterium CSU_1_4]|nr:type II toxin-antitoxin system RelE/ParE family toxin [Leptolyngbyaceae cyanobacterium CSU_1_4]